MRTIAMLYNLVQEARKTIFEKKPKIIGGVVLPSATQADLMALCALESIIHELVAEQSQLMIAYQLETGLADRVEVEVDGEVVVWTRDDWCSWRSGDGVIGEMLTGGWGWYHQQRRMGEEPTAYAALVAATRAMRGVR